MNLKNTFQNLLQKAKAFVRKAGTILIVVGIAIIVILLCVIFAVSSKRESKQEPSMGEDAYTAEIEEDTYIQDEPDIDTSNLIEDYVGELSKYNNIVKSVNALNVGLYEREMTSENESYEVKENDFVNNSKPNPDDIQDATEKLINDAEILQAKYEESCLNSYNGMVEIYNDTIGEYNELIALIGDYASLVNAEKKSEISAESTFVNDWEDTDSFFEDIDTITDNISQSRGDYNVLALAASNQIISDYNTVADEYVNAIKGTVIDYIEGLPKIVIPKQELTISTFEGQSEDEIQPMIEGLLEDNNDIIEKYLVVEQITDPTEEWVKQRLNKVNNINKIEAVTKENDPNGLLGKEGGYSSCIYFSVNEVDQDGIPGDSVVDKGTDAGGAIEVYSSREYALNRCDYLSQFDGTLLYSGSYTAVGTMVVRTSYKLDDKNQIRLTNSIITALTELE